MAAGGVRSRKWSVRVWGSSGRGERGGVEKCRVEKVTVLGLDGL
jgi:hypothetical protein